MKPDLRTATNFRIVEESWSDYELEDETVVRVRPVASFIAVSGSKLTGVKLANQVGIWSAIRNLDKAEPARPLDELEQNLELPNMKFRILKEGESKYVTDLGEVRFRVTAKRFARSKYYDTEGQPQYIIESIVSAELPRAARPDEDPEDDVRPVRN